MFVNGSMERNLDENDAAVLRRDGAKKRLRFDEGEPDDRRKRSKEHEPRPQFTVHKCDGGYQRRSERPDQYSSSAAATAKRAAQRAVVSARRSAAVGGLAELGVARAQRRWRTAAAQPEPQDR